MIDARLQAAANQAVVRRGRQRQAIAHHAWRNLGRAPRGNDSTSAILHAFVRETPEYAKRLAAGQTPDEALKSLLADKTWLRDLRPTRPAYRPVSWRSTRAMVRSAPGSGARDYETDGFDDVQQARLQPDERSSRSFRWRGFRQRTPPRRHTAPTNRSKSNSPVAVAPHRRLRLPPGTDVAARRAGVLKNIITARLMQQVGPNSRGALRLLARSAYAKASWRLYPLLALGTSPVTLKEMVTAYGTMANVAFHPTTFVTRIEDRQGHVLAEFAPARPRKRCRRTRRTR